MTGREGAGRPRRRRAGAIACLAFLAVAVPARAQAPVPQRIVTVVPSVTEILFAVGAGPQVVGIGSFDRVPEGEADRTRVGGLLDPDMEAILTLRPDLVILYESQAEPRVQLERAGIAVETVVHAGLADVVATILRLGRRTGHAARATAVVEDLEIGLRTIRDRVAGRPRPRTLLVFSRDPMSLRNVYASGGRGFLHEMLAAAGGDNVFADVADQRVAQASSEILLAAAPEVIIEIRNEGAFDDAVARQERAVWRQLPGIPAVREDQIHFLTGSEFVVPGPDLLSAVEQLARALHPDAF